MQRFSLWLLIGLTACSQPENELEKLEENVLKPKYVTDPVPHDSDDPAIWYNDNDPSKSLILGTDKMETEGGLYTFSLTGEMDPVRKAYPLDRPNNVDIAYGFLFGKDTIDIAVCSERGKGMIRVFELPWLKAIDNGGIPVFNDDSVNNKVMGVALYKRPADHEFFAIVSRKEGAGQENYLHQYLLSTDSNSNSVKGTLVRQFGQFSGTKEIEAVAVDNESGYVYYSDERFGIRKYYADPEKGNEELAVFGKDGFSDDREGISIYKNDDGTGYILVSDQGANAFRVFPREGTTNNPHNHPLLRIIPVNAISSDGSEVMARSFGEEFPNGLFVAMSDNKTFEIYNWTDFQQAIDDK